MDVMPTYTQASPSRPDASLSTRGDPANANNKLRPERILAWEDFPARQKAIWGEVMDSEFAFERYFPSVHYLKEMGEKRQRMMSSELDLHLFQRSILEDHVSVIIEKLYNHHIPRRKFRLQGAIKFENHTNTLSSESQVEEGMQQISVSGARPRQSPPAIFTDPAAETSGTKKSSRPHADQFCVYNTSTSSQGTEHRIAAFVIEYKVPHELSLGYIYEGLHDMDLDEVLCYAETDTSQERFRRLIAAVITQAFSYMVQAGLEYGCVSTGEAFIFLRVPDDPRTVYYYLSVPLGDVGETTGWTPDSEEANRLHLTAVGQMLAFTLQALQASPRSQQWRVDAAAMLNSWVVVYDDLFEMIPAQDAPSSEYRPQRNKFLLMSPVQVRQRSSRTSLPHCGTAQDRHDVSDEEPDSDTPSQRRSPSRRTTRNQATTNSSPSSRGSRGGAHSGPYCTQSCLRGLVNGGLLDMLCPNVRDHGESHHQIDQATFLALIREQLSQDLDTNCKPIGRPGACGVPFWIRLKSYGYTLVAKGTPVDYVHRLRWEATIYEHLRSIQGIHVPVHLGNINLVQPYYFEGIAQLVHMMFLSFGGEVVHRHITAKNEPEVIKEVERSARAVQESGVLQNDLMPRNMLWNKEIGSIMIIDFERAEFVKPRAGLGVLSDKTPFVKGFQLAAMELRGFIRRQ